MRLMSNHSIAALVRLRVVLLFTLAVSFVDYRPAFATLPPAPPFDRTWSDTTEPFLPYYQLDLHRQLTPGRDIGNYIWQFQLTCDFLDSMQEHNRQDANFGGLHEGEGPQLWAIVETDNTQEAIRVWCLYAADFMDLNRYRENIEAAWTYCDSYPAWAESEPGEMYGLHNAGWGLMAEMAYRRVYGGSRREYGLRCARHLVEHTPEITNEMQDILMPLVAGWTAGTLYRYSELENNESFRQNALRIANQVKNWIDFRPARLNNNEIWALCGGTAMWGILNSLGRADSSGTGEWAIERLQQMDVFAGRGNWNNSWNIWYAHAWHDAFRLIGDDDYRINAIAIVDSLMRQDRDRDGGIPATIGDGDNRDQAWVSAYTAWMGLWNNFDALPEVNLRIARLAAPNINRPWPVNMDFNFIFELQQQGALMNVQAEFGLSRDSTHRIEINGWRPIGYFYSLSQDLPVGIHQFSAFVNHRDEFDRSDDTLYFALEILPVCPIVIMARNYRGEYIGCRLAFYNTALPIDEPPIVLISTPQVEELHSNLMVGEYRVLIEPDFPYADSVIAAYRIERNWEYRMELVFDQPPVLLVDNSGDTALARYYTTALEALDYPYHLWNTAESGVLSPQIGLFNTVIYYSGIRSDGAILNSDQVELSRFNRAGKNIFITGQNISDEFADTPFLSDVLYCRHLADNVRRSQALGIAGDPISDMHNYLLIGNRGANNQTSPAGITPVNGGIAGVMYPDRPDTFAGVRWTLPGGGKGIFLAFGFEGISGQGGTTPRDTLLASIFRWFDVPRRVGEFEPYPHPVSYYIITAFPNPFNNYINITIPTLGSNKINNISIIDLQGRLVRDLEFDKFGRIVWDGRNWQDKTVGSGSYFIILADPNNNRVQNKRIVHIK